jgi:sulfate/thiosulfate transport system substrate-binding protein
MGKRQLCLAAAGGVLASLTLLLAACGGADEDATGEPTAGELQVVGYPGLDSAYEGALEPAFEKSIVGEGIGFGNSFGPSDEQSRAVAEGAPAAVVNFEQAGEMELLVEEGVVDANWDEQRYGGIAHDTVVVFIVRKGNPKQIHSVRDILDHDVDVITPNPFSSDAGRWNVMDVYATLIHERKTEAEALAGVKAVLEKAVAQPDSAAAAFDAFLRGQGDVLLAYESEAIQAVEAGEGTRFQFLVPHQTMLVEMPIAVTEEAPEPAAEDFLKFLWSEPGQILWAEEGYRPVESTLVNQERFFPRDSFEIAHFGGWAKVNEEFFDEETGSIARIERELGVPTGG